MKFALLSLCSLAFAAPQGTPASPTTASVAPKPVGVLPKEGLSALPWPGQFADLASLAGYDPAKATPNPGSTNG
jgi:hypothetical protein